MKNVINKLNVLLSDLNIIYTKLHNYHYNIVGSDFLSVHTFLEDEYDIVHDWIDIIAEEIKKVDGFPLTKLIDYVDNGNIDEADSKNYYSKEIFESLIKDYKIIIEDMNNIKDENIDTLIDLMNQYIDILNKKIWIMKSLIK